MGNTEYHQWKAAHLRMQDWLMLNHSVVSDSLQPHGL